LTLSRLIITLALAVSSLASMAQSQDLMDFDRASFGSVVLSRTQAVGTDFQLELSVGSYETEPPPTKVEGFSGLERLRRTVGSFPTEVGGFKPDFWKVKLGIFCHYT
jgi:hypothetical protein